MGTARQPSSADCWRDLSRFAVAADHEAASRAGAEILARGGNAVDAAVATSFTLAVVRPQSCGLGGSGFMLIHRMGHGPIALDFRETAPAAALRERYLGENGRPIPGATRFGGGAVAAPSQVQGLLHALERYGSGRVSRRDVIAPAIRVAAEPLIADRHVCRASREICDELTADPDFARRFSELYSRFTRDGKPLDPGDAVDRRDMVETLTIIAERGIDGVRDGRLADAMVQAAQQSGGALRHADLREYQVRERDPIVTRFGPFEVIGMPPPSSGGAVTAQVLQVLALHAAEHGAWRANDPASAHLLVEAIKHAFADRASRLGDDAEDVRRDVAWMTSQQRARQVLSAFDPTRTRPTDFYGKLATPEDSGTSHYCVVDGEGNAVSGTDTVNLTFGSLILVPGTGIILNNEIDDFVIDPETPNAFGLRESPRNLFSPGRRPLSSMSPAIVLRDGRAELIAGASGGPRIISATLETILYAIVCGMDLDDAVAAPRLHHQWLPDEIWLSRTTSRDVVAGLLDRGHTVRWYPGTGGHVQAIGRRGDGWRAVCDPDKGGRPAGE